MQEASLKKRYSIKLFSNIISGIMGAILVAIVPKALGPVAYGQFVYLQDFFMKAIGFLDMGSSMAFFTKLSARHSRKELITFYFLYTLAVLATLSAVIFFIKTLGYSQKILPDIPSEYIYMGLFFGFFTWLTQIFIKVSDAYALTVSVELVKVGHKIVSLLLLLYFVHFTFFDLQKYYYFHYIALFSFLIIVTFLFVKKGIFTKQLLDIKNIAYKSLIREFIEYCHPLLTYNIVGLMAGFFDIWLLQKIAGSVQTGFYGLSYSLAAMCFLFTSAMTPIITREFAKSFEEKDMENMKRLFYRYIPMLYSIAAYFAVFVSVQSENVLEIFTDAKFQGAYPVLMIMALYPIHQTYGQLSGSIFYATGQTKLLRNISLFTMPFGTLVAFILIYMLDLGAMGLAWKMLIIQFMGVSIQLYFNAKFLDLELKYFVLHQIYAVAFFIFLALVASHIISFDSPLTEFLVSGFLYTVLVIIFSYALPQVFAINRVERDQMLKKVIHVIKK